MIKFFRKKAAPPSPAVEAENDKGSAAASPAPPPSLEPGQGPVARADNGGLFFRLRDGLAKTRTGFAGRMDRLLLGKREITTELLDELEEILFTSDIGVATSAELIEDAKARVARRELKDPEKLKEVLKERITAFLEAAPQSRAAPQPGEPLVVMVIGVNGVGKTTTIGKAAHRYSVAGQTVLLVAADTFRAAAVEQLAVWGGRTGAQVVKQQAGADPSAVVFDGLSAALARRVDVVLIDTAGRLHTKTNLMEELEKVKRVAGRKLPGAPHEVWLVLDATTGQNALSQAELFHSAIGVTHIVLTKLDGTAKGGIVVGITRTLGLPVKFIGIGERVDDLRSFEAREFVQAIFD